MSTQESVQRGREIERKFLVSQKPDFVKDCGRVQLRQGYLIVGETGTEVRVRQEGKRYFLTVKSEQGASRAEEELRIDRKRFDALWPLTKGRRVRKVRYFVPHHETIVEVDDYRRQLKGLVTAEVEFPDEQAAQDFQPPEWLGRELTDDARFSNQSLALHGRPTEASDVTAGRQVPSEQ